MTDATQRIVNEIQAIPYGKVSCYGGIALKAGLPNGARSVVRVLHTLSKKLKLPWHRVIRKDGRVALHEGEGRELQICLLQSEGVRVSEFGIVDMRKFAV